MAFINHNLNPMGKKTSDCAIRAVAAATGLSWEDTYKGLAESGLKLKTTLNDVEAINDFLISRGFKKGKINIQKGQPRITVNQFVLANTDKYCVLRIANHLTASAFGNYIDIWDCGDKCVYTYWYKFT